MNINKLNNSLQVFYNKIKTSWLYFYIGDIGLNIIYYKNNKPEDSHFCNIDDISKDDSLMAFLKKYKNSNAKFLVNSKDITINHESFTVFNTFSKLNPIDKFCETNFQKSDIYSYNIYKIDKDHTDVWKSVICVCPFNQIIERCFHLINDNSITFSGIYLYQTTIIDIAYEIAKKNNLNLEDYIYTTTSISSVNGINFTIHHGKNILSSVNVDYPHDKSQEYIQGIIEQNISDLWIALKSYCENSESAKANIYILPTQIKELISNNKNDEQYINLFDESSYENSSFSDSNILNYLLNSTIFQSTSKLLKNHFFYNQINNMLFKPLYLSIAIIFLYMIITVKDNYFINSSIINTYSNYFNINEKIRLTGEKYPTVENISQLVDLYIINNSLERKKHLPFNFIEDFLKFNNNENEINKIKWIIDLDSNIPIFKITMNVMLDNSLKHNKLPELDKKIMELKNKYNDLDITLSRLPNKNSDDITSDKLGIKIIARGINDHQ